MATIADQPDVDVIGDVGAAANLTELVEQSRPDVLILALEDKEKSLGECGFLIGRYLPMIFQPTSKTVSPSVQTKGDCAISSEPSWLASIQPICGRTLAGRTYLAVGRRDLWRASSHCFRFRS